MFSLYCSIVLTPIFVLYLQLGHNLGCDHNREDTRSSHDYGHGVQVPGVLRTLMSYSCNGSSCPPVPLFSANGYTYRSGDSKIPIGSRASDNARVIRENVAKVASWKPTKVGQLSPSAPANAPAASPSSSSDDETCDEDGWFGWEFLSCCRLFKPFC